MAYKLAIANIKGGCGKTTTAVNIADQLMRNGKKVLLVDADPQRNATITYRAEFQGVPTLADIFDGEYTAKQCIQTTPFGDIVAGDDNLIHADTSIKPGPKMYKYMVEAFKDVEDLYDVIIVDCPPKFGIIIGNVLEYVNGVICPVQCDLYGVQGVNDFAKIIDEFKYDNKDLKVLGILKTMYDKNYNLVKELEKNVLPGFAERLGTKVYNKGIRRSVKCQEALSKGIRLSEHNRACGAYIDYEAFVKNELMEDIK